MFFRLNSSVSPLLTQSKYLLIPPSPLERQKLCRKIKRLKKELETQKESAKKQSSLQSDLLEKRVDLNYILVSMTVAETKDSLTVYFR